MDNKINSIKAQLKDAADRKDNDAIDKIFGGLTDEEIELLGWACVGDSRTCNCAGYKRSKPPNGVCSSCSHYAYDHKH